MAAKRQVLLRPGEEGWWVVHCPSLPGCISQGRTQAEALENIKEAIQAYTESLELDGETVPEDHLDASLVVVG
ncbi:MAG: type II toxin-antitoxin system HicB family antitoxin [Candidatus Thermoplasmatota archaeon]